MIELHNVSKQYKQGSQRVDALRGVELSINKPGFFAVMGPSGSGKTTLLHLLAGLDQPDEGSVTIAGQDITTANETELTTFRRKKIGIVFQQFNLIPTLTARQNVALPGVIDGRPRAWIDERVDKLLEQLGMSERGHHRPDALSGGEQQRIAIARAMLFEPKLLLADEPTGNLDSASSDRMWRLLAELSESQSITVLMVTHEPAAAAHCQHVYVLNDGAFSDDFEVNGLDASGVASRYQRLGR